MTNSGWPPARLKDLRKNMGITQQALALRLGVTEDTIQNWESGRRTPHRFIWPKLAEMERSIMGQ